MADVATLILFGLIVSGWSWQPWNRIAFYAAWGVVLAASTAANWPLDGRRRKVQWVGLGLFLAAASTELLVNALAVGS